ncbi:MAG TPA: VOC family protein [Candidatus Baltobacteraceae bacterium]
MIKDIAFTAYPAKNVETLRAFYSDVLGLSFSGPYLEDGVLKYDEANVGSSWFSIMTSEWGSGAPAASVAFEVDDIERTLEDLKRQGIEAGEIHDTPVCRLSSFNDPEGNRVTLHQTTVPH